MTVQWTGRALADLRRLHRFLQPKSRQAADRALLALTAAPAKILENPRSGERVLKYEPRDVRRIIVGRYEMHYELLGGRLMILRIWHGREDR